MPRRRNNYPYQKPQRGSLEKRLSNVDAGQTQTSNEKNQNKGSSSTETDNSFVNGPSTARPSLISRVSDFAARNQHYGIILTVFLAIAATFTWVGGLNGAVSTLQGNVTEIEDKAEELAETSSAHSASLENITSGIDGLRSDISDMRNDFNTVIRTEERVNSLSSDVDEVRLNNAQHSIDINSLKFQVDQNSSTIQRLDDN